jgi:hypothetical protein
MKFGCLAVVKNQVLTTNPESAPTAGGKYQSIIFKSIAYAKLSVNTFCKP